jgi:hypothetical protein
MTGAEFDRLLADLADAWTRRDYRAVAARFAPGVAYADPVRYAFTSRDDLLAFFENDDGLEQSVRFHLAIFDERRGIGAAEYTYIGNHTYHGVVLVRVREGEITHWREYQHTSPLDWAAFVGDTRFVP